MKRFVDVLGFVVAAAGVETSAGAAVPANMQGIWGKYGRCDLLADRLTVTRQSAGWGKGPVHRVRYDDGAIFWDQEYVVDNFVIGRTPDVLIHNTQGFHMPGEEGYARCGTNLVRLPWPPPKAAIARQPDRFAYKFAMTPEEGPTDPAIDKRYSSEFTACQKRAISTTANVECFDGEFIRQDKVLNRVWKVTLGGMPGASHGPLLHAQRRWIAARDPFCRKQAAEFEGGTIAPVVYANCRVEQTIRRAMWLEKLR